MKKEESRRWLGVAVGVLAASLIALLVAWDRNGWSLNAAALTGDAAAPLVGIASLSAVIAALWSVRQQAKGLELQRRALDSEIAHRRQESLARLYAPVFVAADAWLKAVESYWLFLMRFSDEDLNERAAWAQPVLRAHEEVARCVAPISLLDPKRGWKARAATREIRLQPVMDIPPNQRMFADVIHYKLLDRRAKLSDLKDAIHRDLGMDEVPRSDKGEAFMADMMAKAKARANDVEEEINRQYREFVQPVREKPDGDDD